MPPRDSKFIDYRIIKEHPSYKLTFLVSTYNKRLSVTDLRKQIWHIEKITDKYKGFNVQKPSLILPVEDGLHGSLLTFRFQMALINFMVCPGLY
jgi:hypothetical protein